MRFFANGPWIPDELLIARDEGRVIFFCGSGVSRARAYLPNFLELAQKVIEILGTTSDSPVRKIVEEIKNIEKRTGESGLISVDRVFGLLEREFLSRDIEEAVAMVLRPPSGVDLSAHKIILDLARGPDGKIRLVTTNFDLLFECCDNSIQYCKPPRLPDPLFAEEFQGIIHLHGHVDKDYSCAEGDGFILSSSEFGRAYLSEGWATQFIKSILERYFVLFIGYTADDPPVQYLLEALHKHLGSLKGIYAFQYGSAGEAEAKWRHKGVQPIVYDEEDNHKTLWDTLAKWANRARDPEEWYRNVITKAQKNPEVLLPHERGQIAHVVSTIEGIRKFCSFENPPSAEWLCVFDPTVRSLTPGYLSNYSEHGPYFDPVDAYGLDSDPPPPKINPDNHFAKREIPGAVWDAFAVLSTDRQNLQDDNIAALRGYRAFNVSKLPARLEQLGVWLSKVSNQPAAVWWASMQVGIHSDIQDQILIELEQNKKDCSPEVRKAWRCIFEAWDTKKSELRHDWYQLKAAIDVDGWSNAMIREFAKINRPYFKVQKPFWGGPKPPESKENIFLNNMLDLGVEYPSNGYDVQIPDEFLVITVREFRKNLEHAVYLERELGGYGLHHLCSIEPDPELEGESTERKYGISSLFLFYIELLKKLIESDNLAAKQEYLAWWTDDDIVFARLRIWASGDPRICSGSESGKLFCELSDEVFWDSRHQRDLLLVLEKRWNDFSAIFKKRLEWRLLRGPSRRQEEKKEKFIERRARFSLNRIHWLANRGCKLSFNLEEVTNKLHKLIPRWQQQHAEKAAVIMEGSSGWVRTDTEYSDLITEPLDTLLSKAMELSGRIRAKFVESDPFAGLSSERPVRAFAALTKSTKRKEYPVWAWRTFLDSEARKSDKPKFAALIAERISRLPMNTIAELIYPISEWFIKSSKVLLSEYPERFERLWVKLITILRSEPVSGRSNIVRTSKEPYWAEEAITSPVGKLAEVLMNDPIKDNLEVGKGFPKTWIDRVEELLALEGDLRRHALVMFAFNLNWFYVIDPIWTEKNLISVLNREGDDKNAFWAGFFWRAKIPNKKLSMQLKHHMLSLAQRKSITLRNHAEILSGILLAGWGTIDKETGDRCITNAEMRETLINSDEDFRVQILWHLEDWSSKEKEESWAENLPIFLKEVWPRHKKAKSPKVSAKLCDLAFSNEVTFPSVVDAILPLVTKVDDKIHFMLHNLTSSANTIVEKYSEKTLALLYAILSENVSAWPYRIEEILERIGVANPSLLKDNRLVELNRRWNAR